MGGRADGQQMGGEAAATVERESRAAMSVGLPMGVCKEDWFVRLKTRTDANDETHEPQMASACTRRTHSGCTLNVVWNY